MNLLDHVKALRRAGSPLAVIDTADPTATIARIAAGINGGAPKIAWDLVRGVLPVADEYEEAFEASKLAIGSLEADNAIGNPAGMITEAEKLPEKTILFIHNAHRYMDDIQFVQAVWNLRDQFKSNRRTLVLLGPQVNLPPELSNDVIRLSDPLPDRDEIGEIINRIHEDNDLTLEDDAFQAAVDATSGLSAYQVEQAVAMSISPETRQMDAESLWELKRKAIEAEDALKVYREEALLDNLGGMEELKRFVLAVVNTKSELQAKGVMLLGVPGTGKSQFAKAIGYATGRPTVMLNVGALMGGLVGQSEANVRRVLKTVDAMAPCILMIDEVEKGLSGVQSSGQTDSGVTARVFGDFLTWLNDHTSDVFVICTCNDIAKLPPEFSRSGRFDGIFFLDLPSSEQKAMIWDIWTARYGVSNEDPIPNDDKWTGAEIEACCRLAALQDVSLRVASRNVIPIAITAGDKVNSLREWASGRCLGSESPGRFDSNPTSNATSRRDIELDRIVLTPRQ